MAATARRDFDSGEEDIAAIAKQISDHAEAIYQNWKARGLAPTEILSCKPGTGLRLTDNLNDKDSEIDREFEFNHPPDIVPQKPEAPKRPVGLGVRKGAALEVAREEERLMKALRTGAVLAERPSSRPPDVVPSLSYVDYAKNRYQDRLENPPTRRSERERRASVGAQVMETKTKFEARVRRASSAGATPSPGIVEQTAPVRPFLTRGSVAERVMMFEKCPSEVMMDNKRKAPAVAAWRAQHDANKVQNHAAAKIPLPSTVNVSIPRENGIGPTNTEQPAKTTSSTTKSATANSLKSATKSSGGILKPASAPAHTTLRRGVRARPGDGVPKFHFPKGRPPPSHAVEKALHNVQSAISTFPNSQVPRESFHHVVRGSGCPLYWKMPLFLATQQSLHSPVDGRTFIEFWKKMTSECHDQASRLVYVLTRGASNTLAPEDFIPMVQDVVDTHPGLSFLKEANEFHSRYVHTVIARIFYCVNRSWTGRITIPELRKSNLLQVIQLLEEEEDINQVTAYFSYEHFYVIYCKFWELDRDHDLFIDKNDLARHNDHALSSRMIERVLSGCVTRGNQNRVTADGEPRMSYTEFVWFLLAEEDKMHPTAIEYWFRCMDLDGDGYLSMYELEYFYEEQTHRMEAIGIETLPFLDCLCQMLDMVHPGEDGKVTLSDLKKCKMTPVFFDTFFNLEKYLDHEQRDPFASQRDGESDMSEWDRFAAEEYELLVAEEGGSDAQDQISYDETDEDCLSPNLDEITSAEIIEDSSIEDSSLNDGMHCFSQRSKTDDPATYSTRAQINHQNGPGYVNLNSIYSLSANERWQPTATSPIKNGSDKTLKLAPNEKPMTPEKPVSLTMVNGRTDNRYASFGGNNSFLYSHVSTNQNGRARDPPSYTTATSGHLFNRMSSDKVTSPILSPCHSGRINSPFSPNKISENYERAVAERLSPQRETAKIHPGIFCATVGKQIKSPTKYKDDEDDDYARDSDECSI